jgi:hypothetical protein
MEIEAVPNRYNVSIYSCNENILKKSKKGVDK